MRSGRANRSSACGSRRSSSRHSPPPGSTVRRDGTDSSTAPSSSSSRRCASVLPSPGSCSAPSSTRTIAGTSRTTTSRSTTTSPAASPTAGCTRRSRRSATTCSSCRSPPRRIVSCCYRRSRPWPSFRRCSRSPRRGCCTWQGSASPALAPGTVAASAWALSPLLGLLYLPPHEGPAPLSLGLKILTDYPSALLAILVVAIASGSRDDPRLARAAAAPGLRRRVRDAREAAERRPGRRRRDGPRRVAERARGARRRGRRRGRPRPSARRQPAALRKPVLVRLRPVGGEPGSPGSRSALLRAPRRTAPSRRLPSRGSTGSSSSPTRRGRCSPHRGRGGALVLAAWRRVPARRAGSWSHPGCSTASASRCTTTRSGTSSPGSSRRPSRYWLSPPGPRCSPVTACGRPRRSAGRPGPRWPSSAPRRSRSRSGSRSHRSDPSTSCGRSGRRRRSRTVR